MSPGPVRSARVQTLAATAVLAAALAAPGARAAQAPPPDVDTIVARAAAYVADYESRLSSVVAEERYEQRLRELQLAAATGVVGTSVRGTTTKESRRRLVSDYLLVKVAGLSGWLPFRDVISVDGRKVHDRDQRLSRLFLESPADAMDQALRVARESSRFNLGYVQRNTNVPTLALLFLTDRHRPRLTFRLEGGDSIDGVDTVRLAYVESGRPTLIHGKDDVDIVADGVLWVEPGTGRILQTRIHTDTGSLESEIVVTYREDRRMGLLVPWRMRESYRSDSERVEGTATYTNFRKFQVKTGEAIKKRP
jgi:hypothetical protein